MTQLAPRSAALVVLALICAACSAATAEPDGAAGTTNGGAPTVAQGGQTAANTAGTSLGGAGANTAGLGATSAAGTAGAASAGAGGTSSAGSGGATALAGAAGSASTAGSSATAGASGSAGSNNACGLPAVVSYQKDVQPFLIKGCGGGNGCHVIDTQSTMASGGFNHGYDWLTAGAHASSCPTTPKRFEIVLDVLAGANPQSCSKSRQMPPPNATGAGVRTPLTQCEVAALQAWLAEPMVTQMHRADDSSPTTPYLMPPFN